jgi:hypothetical protein
MKGTNVRFRDGLVPKNKDPEAFNEACQEETRTKTYLSKKLSLHATYNNMQQAKDLPTNHVFGVSTDKDNTNMQYLLNHQYATRTKMDDFERVENDYKPHLSKYCLKPPKPTQASKLRKQVTNMKLTGGPSTIEQLEAKFTDFVQDNTEKTVLPIEKAN